ncbi:hypothetical protein BHYA_0194g00120 [Botrytis hyacinthi]|uniref:Uncharacterized protein n=1 Tax=Botrytis hyacinthi TaxID=278943 RepID=A0A4Z1GCJ0_9HELO|nr:hypothetical protein BHYA_0194g00120 [Botrytis hyacinthi]
MQPQAKADGDVETSIRRPKINATDVLNYMKDFSQEFQRPGSNTITQHAVSEMNLIVYDVDYTVVHNPSQGTGGEGYIRKDKMTTEQRHSHRELSNVIRHGNSLANSFMKIETGLLDLRFDERGSASLREKIAAGQRIALRIYIQDEIKRRAADLGLVKLGFCETSLIRDVAKRIVERRRTMTQAEGNVFADDIFQREFKPDVEDESGVGYIEPFLKRSKEIRNEISELIWNLQFDLTFARTMSNLLPLNYGSWAKETTTPKGLIKRKRTLPVTQNIASTQNAYGAWEMPSGVIVAPPPKPAFDQPLAYAPPALMPGATASLTGSLPPPPPWSTGMMAGYWGHDNGTIDLSALDTQFDQFNPTSLADAGGLYMPDDAPSPPLFADF